MKKVYFLGAALLVGGLNVNAQRIASSYTFGSAVAGDVLSKQNLSPNRPTHSTENGDRALTQLWSENFTGATGMTTPNGAWTTGGTNPGYWTIGTSPFTGFGNALTAPYAVWNSYSPINTAGEPGGFATTPTDGEIISPTIDLSATSTGALLRIKMDAMYCCNYQEEPYRVAVSNDNGVTWSAPIDLVTGLDRNVATNDVTDPWELTADISIGLDATPANNNDCKIKFIWDANTADPNGQFNSHYIWIVDQIQIFEVPPYEVVHQRLWKEDVGGLWEYGDLPVSQAQNLIVQSKVLSLGANVPTGFVQEVEVFNSSMTSVFGPVSGGTLGGANGPLSIGVVDTITFATSLDLATLPLGTYDIRVVTKYNETDESPENDTLWRSINITSNRYSHADYDQATTPNSHNSDTRAEVGADFNMYENGDLHGIDVFIDNSGSIEIEIMVYQENGTATPDLVVGPYKFDVTAGMGGQWNTFNLHQDKYGVPYTPYTLLQGEVYIPVFSVQQGDVFNYRSNASDDDNSGLFYHDNDGLWYSTGDEPWIAINFDQALSTEKNIASEFTIGQNVPNPFGDNTIINYSIENASNVTVEFKDVSGKVVKTVNQGTQAAGSYQLNVAANEFAEGVYFYTFTIGEKQVTKRMVVTK